MQKKAMSYENITNGALAEQVDALLKDILANIQNPNTPWKPKRELNIKLIFIPNEERDNPKIQIQASAKLASLKGIETDCYITTIHETLVAFERIDPRQPSLFDNVPATPPANNKPDLKVVGGEQQPKN